MVNEPPGLSPTKTHHTLPQIFRKAWTADAYENYTAIGGHGGEANHCFIECDINIHICVTLREFSSHKHKYLENETSIKSPPALVSNILQRIFVSTKNQLYFLSEGLGYCKY